MRTHDCGALRREHAGAEVVLTGWVNRRRDLGGLVFIDLRDRFGLTQVVVEPQTAAVFEAASALRSEYVLKVTGTVRERPDQQRAKHLATGEVEVLATGLEVLSRAKTPPFLVDGSVDASEVNEELRLKHRYLDLRRPDAREPLMLRHRVTKAIWDHLDERRFVQVETPLLTLSTPEGARDYVVPARVRPGEFYALPQSPQLFKQMLMMAGFDRYFQIARCFRDEDLRADRQPDFTQLDIEMSFVTQDDILALNEGLLQHVVKQATGREITTPFPRLTYQEALARYGSDKPDVRFGLELTDLSSLFRDSQFEGFAGPLGAAGKVMAIHVGGSEAAGISRKHLADLEARAKQAGAKGLAWLRRSEDGFSGPIAKFLSPGEIAKLALTASAVGDLLLLVGAASTTACTALGAVRLALADLLGVRPDASELAFLWVVDFPLLDPISDEHGRESFTYMHHPFTRPHDDDVDLLATDPGSVRAYAYDLVLNGNEVGGGSLRIHRHDLQLKMFSAIGIDMAEAERRFGFFLDALSYGAPPHGGIAWGLDRLVMLLAGVDSIRDTIAFPKIQSGVDPLTGAPGPLEAEQLAELGLQVVRSPAGGNS